MPGLSSVKIIVTGRVQGVMFRDFTRRHALSLEITGWVRNGADGHSVEILAEGQAEKLEELISRLNQGPPQASVQKTKTTWGTVSNQHTDFTILR